jgi:hypothetical protein
MTNPIHFKHFFNLNVHPKLLHFGNRCPDEFLQTNLNYSSEDAIFFYGVQYHLRAEFLDVAENNWKVVTHERPREITACAVETATEMYKYTYAFTTGYDFSGSAQKCNVYYLVAKFFEIMGSGCLLLCDDTGVKEELNALGFFENEHYLNINKQNSAQVRDFVTSNPQKVKEIRTKAHELVKSKYTVQKACEKINRAFNTKKT